MRFILIWLFSFKSVCILFFPANFYNWTAKQKRVAVWRAERRAVDRAFQRKQERANVYLTDLHFASISKYT